MSMNNLRKVMGRTPSLLQRSTRGADAAVQAAKSKKF